MPHTPPIKLSELAKSDLLKEDRFYQLLSEKCNYLDKDTARAFYMGLVKTISQELRTNGVIRLPHLGDMALVHMKPKSVLVGMTRQVVSGLYALKFYPNKSFREYFAKYRESNQNLDPREKILREKI